MKTNCEWNGKMNFVANINGFKVHMDAVKPFGDETAPAPKDLVFASLCGCTGMDVVALMKKYKQSLSKFNIEAEASVKKEHPHEFQDIFLKYFASGQCEAPRLIEAIKLSQTQYCPVSSMISRGAAIKYEVILNGKKVGDGQSHFSQSDSHHSFKEAQ